ncbi:MAG: D-glycero-beta-D-manno-heptose 1-phosphate adenylyltransferase [Thermomicrobiales bacterium]
MGATPFGSPVDVVRGFPGLRALVIGEAMLDTWLEGEAIRLCKEAPVPVVRQTASDRCPGGAANTAANLAALGAEVLFVSLVGRDAAGNHLRQALRDAGVDDAWLVADDRISTLHKLRVIADGQYVVRFDDGDIAGASERSRVLLLRRIAEAYVHCDVVVISDYCHGLIDEEVIAKLRELRAATPNVLAIDAKQIARFHGTRPTLVTPNLAEARLAVDPAGTEGIPLDPTGARQISRRLRDMLDAEHIAVTMAEDGVLLTGPDGEQEHVPCHPVQRASDVGAGDTFTAATALALSAGAPVAQAVRIGIDAASIVITRGRTSLVTSQELLRRVSLDGSGTALSLKELVSRLDEDRFLGRRIVFTNGVFDILHAGHVQLLRRAKALGDVLVVGINSDASTRRLKGPTRPVNRESDRLALVSALDAVDYAVLFAEDTPDNLIRAIRPDIHVKGGDYDATTLPEIATVREVGARVEILSLVDGRSTTAVIDRILATAGTVSEQG